MNDQKNKELSEEISSVKIDEIRLQRTNGGQVSIFDITSE